MLCSLIMKNIKDTGTRIWTWWIFLSFVSVFFGTFEVKNLRSTLPLVASENTILYKQSQICWEKRYISGHFWHSGSQYTFTPSPLINVVLDLVMTFKVTSDNIERGRGVRNFFKFSICFQECVFGWKSMLFMGECLNNFATAVVC